MNLSERPFASPDEEATGEFFIGRVQVLDNMQRDIIDSNKVYNYHVVGLPRIGKSSLLKAFKSKAIEDKKCPYLVVVYISLDTCSNVDDMWKSIGKMLRKELNKCFSNTEKYKAFIEELEFEDINESVVDYEYVCAVARCMKNVGFHGLVMIDEFDNFSTIATRGTVGQFRTLFSSAESGIRAILASRRMVERIEQEVAGAVNANVSTLAPIFMNGCKLSTFNNDDMLDYWSTVSTKFNKEVSENYKNKVRYYVGAHPCLLNLLNGSYWLQQKTTDYMFDESHEFYINENLVKLLHDAFNWAIWRDMEKWGLLRSLILLTWGPATDISQKDISELVRYGIIDENVILFETNGPMRIAVSRYFTEWMKLRRYCLPFGDEWSNAERNMRALIKAYCDEVYRSDEERMIRHLETKNANTIERYSDQRYTAKGRFDAMRSRMKKNINKYPDMSSSIIDYSDPSDLPEIFFKREWGWFVQIFNKTWDEWQDKFATMNEVRNIQLHNNHGMPKVRIELAKKYCHEVNEKIESFLSNRDNI